MKCFMKTLRACCVLLVLMSLLLGGVYPLLVTGIAQGAFAYRANGSLVMRDGKVIGSELLGQQFDNEWYFWGRPSGVVHGDGILASGGSNLGPTNDKMLSNVMARVQALQAPDPQNKKHIPIDLVTASASGLDPDISVDAARYQVARIAAARKIPADKLEGLIARHKQSFGADKLAVAPYVNVLELNLALDVLAKKQP